jgi:hypothetical protein
MNTLAQDIRRYSSASYGEDELEAFAKAFIEYVPEASRIVEIGCQFGSSSAAILRISQEKGYFVYFCDPFTFVETGNEEDVGPRFIRRMLEFKTPFSVLAMKSIDALQFVPGMVDALHIDGDHSREGISLDCKLWIPRLNSGGILICHDYGRCGCPDVQPVLDYFTVGWKLISAPDGAVRILQKP